MTSIMDTILYKAAMEGDCWVLRKNADQLQVQRTPNNNTILHVAAQFGKTEGVKSILKECGRSLLFVLNVTCETALHISAREGHTDTVLALIHYAEAVGEDLESETKGAKEMMRMRNVEGETALYEAVRNNHLDVVDILTKEDPEFVHPPNNAEQTPLYLTAERRNRAIVSKILENCISPAYIGPNGRTALHAATIFYDQECIKSLHTWNSSLVKEANVYGWRPLHYAAWHGNLLAAKQLLDLDKSVAYIVADKDDNKTALHIAASQGHVRVMNELYTRCPDCYEMTNSRGQNILHIAVEHEQKKVIEHILANPFSNSLINQKDNGGNTPLHLLCAQSANHKYHLKDNSRAAYNQKNLTALEVVYGDMYPDQQIFLFSTAVFKLIKEEKRRYQRYVAETNSNYAEETTTLIPLRKFISKISDNNLVVAGLIAAATFAAGFALPGGYDGNDGANQGMAVLIRKTAFKVFVVADTIAMILSIKAVITHISASTYEDEDKRGKGYSNALATIICAIGAMVVAFMTGLYVVLGDSLVLAISVIVICCLFLVNALSWFIEAYLAVAVKFKNDVRRFTRNTIDFFLWGGRETIRYFVNGVAILIGFAIVVAFFCGYGYLIYRKILSIIKIFQFQVL
ncbi:ankyrin repeat-containing protein At5g02620-like [Cornus florida]|uniref:ankyrin repeat-containing protein At5g02620-like n=1 Tax=Cornus florida TaxID=4283 RepID=UPI0028971044|nr:ankyrin repeat-containing protein At5g02620-like [Cornus florida]